MKKYYTIPVFIPEESCPFQCIYCDQKKISGTLETPTPAQIRNIIDKHLETLPENDSDNIIISIGFFGGNFTGIDKGLQKAYLQEASRYIKTNQVAKIRLSTRPDYIDKEILTFLRDNHVSAIELGVQSTDDEVLKKSGRGYQKDTVTASAKMIKDFGFDLGLQMMIGLPGDTREKAIQTARDIIAAKAAETRIYPLLIIKDTKLHKMYMDGKYTPLSMEETIETCAGLVRIFEDAGVKILRLGLHPSDDLHEDKDLIAGPFSPALKQMVLTQIWENIFAELFTEKNKNKDVEIFVSEKEINYAAGYKARNKKKFLTFFKTVKFHKTKNLEKFKYHARIN